MRDLGPTLLIGIVAALGALGGSFLKDLLPNLALEDWKLRQQLKGVFRRYRDPLLLAATELVHRLDEIDRDYPPEFLRSAVKTINASAPTQTTTADLYYQRYKLESSIYRLSAFLGWIELFRQETVFLDSGRRPLNLQIESALERLRAALADGHLNDASDWERWRDALIFREEQRAIGEQMITARGDQRVIAGYALFATEYSRAGGNPWFDVVDRFLLDLEPERDFRRARIRLLMRGLIDLIEVFDSERVNERLHAIRTRIGEAA
ncbi:MAG: hypothetical protein ACYC7A_21630 [Thermoanaerobaculia bacterium]